MMKEELYYIFDMCNICNTLHRKCVSIKNTHICIDCLVLGTHKIFAIEHAIEDAQIKKYNPSYIGRAYS